MSTSKIPEKLEQLMNNQNDTRFNVAERMVDVEYIEQRDWKVAEGDIDTGFWEHLMVPMVPASGTFQLTPFLLQIETVCSRIGLPNDPYKPDGIRSSRETRGLSIISMSSSDSSLGDLYGEYSERNDLRGGDGERGDMPSPNFKYLVAT
ncbi:hypothetical protein GCK72_012024 [Caenorhabditis remanei]|uniref:Uncharacterized protein n=1 Tax=Caenorhabditis remanei TaxID=31234 RepID=A0A6A5GLL5_CAERE|nr:hypothetical protein GCK72_012024 [Caenorhabditis remanei]KAF1755574.1 hypothetical protein GCK72_012024 [Caenorhabditis remanei]